MTLRVHNLIMIDFNQSEIACLATYVPCKLLAGKLEKRFV